MPLASLLWLIAAFFNLVIAAMRFQSAVEYDSEADGAFALLHLLLFFMNMFCAVAYLPDPS